MNEIIIELPNWRAVATVENGQWIVRMTYAGDETIKMTRAFDTEQAFRQWARREASR